MHPGFLNNLVNGIILRQHASTDRRTAILKKKIYHKKRTLLKVETGKASSAV